MLIQNPLARSLTNYNVAFKYYKKLNPYAESFDFLVPLEKNIELILAETSNNDIKRMFIDLKIIHSMIETINHVLAHKYNSNYMTCLRNLDNLLELRIFLGFEEFEVPTKKEIEKLISYFTERLKCIQPTMQK